MSKQATHGRRGIDTTGNTRHGANPPGAQPSHYLAVRGMLLMNRSAGPTPWERPLYTPPSFIDRSITENRFRSQVVLPYIEGSLRFFGTDIIPSLERVQANPDPFQDRQKWALDDMAELIGIFPIPLLASVIHDLLDKTSTLKRLEKNAKYITNTPIRNAGLYYMFHWDNRRGISTYETSKILSAKSKHLISIFKNDFVKNCPSIPDDERVAEDWYAFPGIVITKDACHQTAHRDALDGQSDDISLSPKYWVLHIPLQPEGGLFSTWDCNSETQTSAPINHCFVHVPFGSYLALRLDVFHSGFYGSKGSARLHIIVTQGHCPPANTLHVRRDLDDIRLFDIKRKEAGIKTMEKGCVHFTNTTHEMLRSISGGTLDNKEFNYLVDD